MKSIRAIALTSFVLVLFSITQWPAHASNINSLFILDFKKHPETDDKAFIKFEDDYLFSLEPHPFITGKANDYLKKFCKDTANKLGNMRPVVKARDCKKLKLYTSGHFSRKNLPIMIYKNINASTKNKKRGILIGGVHGDELASTAIVLKWITTLEKKELPNIDLLVIPCLNPDGFFHKRLLRMNSAGIDLNRNLPTPDWNDNASEQWKSYSKNPRYNPGPTANSEPETKMLVKIIEEFKPEFIVAVHAPFNFLDFDMPESTTYGLSDKWGKIFQKEYRSYTGSLGRYAGEYKKIPTATLELRHAFKMPNETEINKIWKDMIDWIEDSSRFFASDKSNVVDNDG